MSTRHTQSDQRIGYFYPDSALLVCTSTSLMTVARCLSSSTLPTVSTARPAISRTTVRILTGCAQREVVALPMMECKYRISIGEKYSAVAFLFMFITMTRDVIVYPVEQVNKLIYESPTTTFTKWALEKASNKPVQ